MALGTAGSLDTCRLAPYVNMAALRLPSQQVSPAPDLTSCLSVPVMSLSVSRRHFLSCMMPIPVHLTPLPVQC